LGGGKYYRTLEGELLHLGGRRVPAGALKTKRHGTGVFEGYE